MIVSHILRSLKVLAVIDGCSTLQDVADRSYIPVSSVKRHLNVLRRLNVVISKVDSSHGRVYKIKSWGPFDSLNIKSYLANARIIK